VICRCRLVASNRWSFFPDGIERIGHDVSNTFYQRWSLQYTLCMLLLSFLLGWCCIHDSGKQSSRSVSA
jgi:hypothetical protein